MMFLSYGTATVQVIISRKFIILGIFETHYTNYSRGIPPGLQCLDILRLNNIKGSGANNGQTQKGIDSFWNPLLSS
jgi:hypothetical protein